MRCIRMLLGFVVLLVFVVLTMAVSLSAQTASTSTVTGTVSDKTGSIVPNAKVDLEDVDTKARTSVTTGNDGSYTFPSVRPGNYSIAVSGKGFRQSVVNGVKVEVGKAATVNVTLELGSLTETVEVTAGTGAELQTINASVGDVLDSNMLANMPTLSRDATSLVLLQPMAIPGFNGAVAGSGEGNTNGGTIAGARMDQNTFMLDGGDATSNMEGGGGYNTGFQASPRAVVPTPVESLEEFRVQTNNAGVDFTRSAGAEVQMVTRRGSNAWHGAGYWYHQNDELNANDWFRDHRPSGGKNFTENPEWRDNRYGGRVGGPIWKNRTFFFLLEEERHFFTQSVFQRLVPSNALRVGILKFKDASTGKVKAYNLNPAPTLDVSACSAPCVDDDPLIGTILPGDNGTLDPRRKGLSPAIAAEWALMPAANDFTAGDVALRAPFFTSTVPNLSNEHDAVFRLDHKINDKWDFMGSYRYSTSAISPPNIQEDISGTAPGCKKGVPASLPPARYSHGIWLRGSRDGLRPIL
jgi:carboxypeptidase family protein